MKKYILFLIGLCSSALILHVFSVQTLSSWFPWPFFLTTALLWSLPHFWVPWTITVIISELFSTLPPGVMLVSSLLPLMIYYMRGRINVDLSFSFLLLIAISTFLQITLVIGIDWWQYNVPLLEGNYWWSNAIPWSVLFITWPAVTVAAWVASIIGHNYIPHNQSNILSLA